MTAVTTERDPDQPPTWRRAAGGTARAAARTGRVSAQASRASWRGVRRATHAHGAGETGLARLIEISGVAAAGDALITVSLAGTLFFSVPVGEARGRVALYLVLTMAPFALLAPVIGPLLDRMRRGRRAAMATTLVLRTVLAVVMAAAVSGRTEDALRLYPAAFGCLVASKAFGVARAAALPRLLPGELSLVSANARVSLSATATATLAVAVGGGLVRFAGPQWALRLGAVVFLAGAALAFRLPSRIDSVVGEQPATLSSGSARLGGDVGAAVVRALRANAGVRAFNGFLVFHLAFLLRASPVVDISPTAQIGFAVAALGVGSAAGASLGALLRKHSPDATVVSSLGACAVAAGLGAWLFGPAAILCVAVVGGAAQASGKLALDAVVQREVPEAVRASAFARSETLLQLLWVLGAGLGTALPPHGGLGFLVAAVALALALAAALGRTPHRRRKKRAAG